MVAFEQPHGMHPPQAQWELPFFDAHHGETAQRLADWAMFQHVDETDDRAACKDWVARLGRDGWQLKQIMLPSSQLGTSDSVVAVLERSVG